MDDETAITPSDPIFTSNRFRLEMKHLFWATALIAAGMGVHSILLLSSLFIIWFWWFVSRKRLTLVEVLVCIAVMGILIGMLLPSVTPALHVRHANNCRRNLQRLQSAILKYEVKHHEFPSDTEIVNASGETIRTSWRVHILPFLDEQSVYDAYRFDEPWNSKHNLALPEKLSSSHFFHCPCQDLSGDLRFKTSYKAVAGPGTVFDPNKTVTPGFIVYGTASTISLVEDVANPVGVFEPCDLSLTEAVALFDNPAKQNCTHNRHEFFTVHYTGFNFAFINGDGRHWSANPSLSESIGQGPFLIADGKSIELNVGTEVVDYRWGRIVSVGLYLLIALYPILWRRGERKSPTDENLS